MHDCRRHEFVIILTFYNRHSIKIQQLKLLVICYIGKNNLACKFRKNLYTLLLCSTVIIFQIDKKDLLETSYIQTSVMVQYNSRCF